MIKVLIVEDEVSITTHLTKFLVNDNFEVDSLDSGLTAVEHIKETKPHLIILDVMLPYKDGITICKEVRTFSDVPIIILTAKVEEIDRLIGLKAGADDYVCKPFSATEMLLRVKAILKRTYQDISHGGLNFDSEKYILSYLNTEVVLTHIESQLFELLFRKPGRIYSREQIIELTYSDIKEISDRAIDSHIKNIRKKIKELGIDSNVIESVYGSGYRYIPLD